MLNTIITRTNDAFQTTSIEATIWGEMLWSAIKSFTAILKNTTAAQYLIQKCFFRYCVLSMKILARWTGYTALCHAAWKLAQALGLIDPNYSIFQAIRDGFVTIARNNWTIKCISSLLFRYNQSYVDYKNIRQHFARTPLTILPSKDSDVHSHPDQAQNRTNAIVSIQNMIGIFGYSEFVIQARPGDVSRGKEHRSLYYWAKDTKVEPSFGTIQPHHVVSIVDTDYYIDMPRQLLKHPNIHMLYTQIINKVSRCSVQGSSSYTLVDDTLHVTVPGGGQYHHQLWDYQHDHVRTCGIVWNNFLPNFHVIDYQVERRKADASHQLIALIPNNHWTGMAALLAYFYVESNPFKRATYKDGDWNIMRYVSKEKEYISLGKAGEYTSVDMPVEKYEQIKHLQATSKVPLGYASLKNHLFQSFKEGDIKAASETECAMLCSYLTERSSRNTAEIYKHFSNEYAVKTYQMYPAEFNPSHQPLTVAFMLPIIHGAFAPPRDISTAIRAVDSRVLALQKDNVMDAEDYKIMNEFIIRMIPNDKAHRKHPLTHSDVFEKQPRPTQQAILNQGELLNNETVSFNSMFTKSETYQNVKDPRGISTDRAPHKLQYATFQYVLSIYLKEEFNAYWYAFGNTPKIISERVAEIAQLARDSINCSDLSRMDGHKTVKTRTLDIMILKRLFHPMYHSELETIVNRQRFSRASVHDRKTDEQWTFTTGDAQPSGFADTSNHNSQTNAFLNFCTYVEQSPRGVNKFDYAWEQLMNKVILGGDDTVAADQDPKIVEKVATRFGYVIESVIYQRGEPGVNFFARIYMPEVWSGEPATTCDIQRTLAKLHVSPVLPSNCTPIQKLSEKLSSLYMTDWNTPIIKEITWAFIQAGGRIMNTEDFDGAAYWSKFPSHEQYTNNNTEWAQTYYDRYNCRELFEYLENVEELDQMLTMPHIADVTPEAKTETIVTVDGRQETYGTKPPLKRPKQPRPMKKQTHVRPVNMADLVTKSRVAHDALTLAFQYVQPKTEKTEVTPPTTDEPYSIDITHARCMKHNTRRSVQFLEPTQTGYACIVGHECGIKSKRKVDKPQPNKTTPKPAPAKQVEPSTVITPKQHKTIAVVPKARAVAQPKVTKQQQQQPTKQPQMVSRTIVSKQPKTKAVVNKSRAVHQILVAGPSKPTGKKVVNCLELRPEQILQKAAQLSATKGRTSKPKPTYVPKVRDNPMPKGPLQKE